MSLKNLLKKTVTDLGKSKKVGKTTFVSKFSTTAGLPHTGDQYGVGDIAGWIPFGITTLDRKLGGGLPLGRISEVFSENESEGKSTLLIHAAVQTQKVNGVVVILDAEAAMDKPRAEVMGLDLSKTIIFGPPTVEDGFQFIDGLIHNIAEDKELHGVPTLIIWDTIAASPTRGEKAGDPFAGGMAEKPRIIAAALRNYTNEFFRYKVHLSLVNQSITNIGGGNYGPKTITPCGKAIKFYSTVRIKTRKSGLLTAKRTYKSEDRKIGIQATVEAVKNKLSLPWQPIQLHLYGETGFHEIHSLADFILANGGKSLAQKGGRYYLKSGKSPYWQGLEKCLLENPKDLEAMRKEAVRLIPVPSNRAQNPETGWFERIAGTSLNETLETEEAPDE